MSHKSARKPRREHQRLDYRKLGVTGVMLLCLGAFTVQLTNFQVVNAWQLNEESANNRAVNMTIPAKRGDILDRNGKVLAASFEIYDVQISPAATREEEGEFSRITGDKKEQIRITREQAYAEIAPILEMKAEDIRKIVDDELAKNPKSQFAYLKRGINLTQLTALKKLGVPWINADIDFRRVYSNGATAGNLIGFPGKEANQGAGIEKSQDECLTGQEGQESYERSADWVRLPGSTVTTKQVEPGGNVELTIDLDLQWQLQQLVNQDQADSGAEWVTAIVLDAKNGEIIAVAEDNSMDPNNVAASDANHRESRSFLSPYEPGSTIKPFSTAMLLEEHLAKKDESITVPSRYRRNGADLGDWWPHGTLNLTLSGVLTTSSNIGTSIFGERLDPQKRYDYLRKYGFGTPTNAGMPVEDSGLLYPPQKWDAQTKHTVTFGQGMSVTPIQLASAYQAIANHGVRVPPNLVRGCHKPDGTFVKHDAGEPERVISEGVDADLVQMMETLTNDELYNKAVKVDGYRIAGKSGTAQESDGKGGYRPDFVSSFSGFFPAEDPKYTLLCIEAFPHKGKVLYPMWRQAIAAIARQMHVPPSQGEPVLLPKGS